MRFQNGYIDIFKEFIDRSEKREELEFMLKEILTYTHNFWRAAGSISVDTTDLHDNLKIIYEPASDIHKCGKFKCVMSNEEFYGVVKKYYDEIEKRKEQHKKDGFDWNNDPFKDWTKEDWENF